MSNMIFEKTAFNYLAGQGIIGDIASDGVDGEQPPHIDDFIS